MFASYQNIINGAIESESAIIKNHDNKKESNTLQIQKRMTEEAENISKNQHLKDYNPIEYYNSITTLKHQRDSLISNEKKELEDLKLSIDEDLFDVMNIETNHGIKEIYKIISCDQSNQANCRYICRVWFTLEYLEQHNCYPGDPIRIEWVDLLGNQNDSNRNIISKVDRTGPGEEGLQIPNFTSTANISSQSFYQINNWGNNSKQKQWWLNWVKNNRPIPEQPTKSKTNKKVIRKVARK